MKPFQNYFNTALGVINIICFIALLWTFAQPTPEVRSTIESRRLIEAQTQLKAQEETNLRIQNEIEKNKLRTTRVQNMTGEQVMEYEKMQLIRKACKGDTRCVLSNL